MNSPPIKFRNKFFKPLLLWFIIIVASEVTAQTYKAVVQPLSEYRFESINEHNGLHNLRLGDFVQDQQGFIWIASEDGLHRYDGKDFQIYLEEDGKSSSVLTSWISTLEVDKQGRIWVAYNGGGFSIYTPENDKFTHFPAGTSGLGSNTIQYLHCDRDGEMWAYISPNQIARLSDKTPNVRTLHPDTLVTHTSALAVNIFEDQRTPGLLWFCGNGLFSYNKITHEWKSFSIRHTANPYNELNYYTNGIALKDGRVVLSAWGTGVTVYNPNSNEWHRYLPEGIQDVPGTHNIIYWLEMRDDHTAWVNTSIGFGYIDINTGIYYIIDDQTAEKYNIPKGNMRRLLRDRENNLWIGHSFGISLLKNNYNRFKFIPAPVTHSENGEFYYLNKILNDTVENLRIDALSFADGIHITDLSTGKITRLAVDYLPNQEHAQLVHDLLKDDKGRYWVLSRDFIYQLDIEKSQLSKLALMAELYEKGATPFFTEFFYSGGDSVWIGSNNAGLLCLKLTDKKLNQYKHIEGDDHTISSNYVSNIQMDGQGRMWVQTKRRLIEVIDFVSGKIQRIVPEDLHSGNSNYQFFDMSMDSKKNIWISGSNGFYYTSTADKGIFRWNKLPKMEGFTTQFFYHFVFDGNDIIWCMTPAGLYSIDPFRKKAERFTITDGLGNDYINASLNIGPNNTIQICYWKGFYVLNQAKNSAPRILKPYLLNFRVWNKPIQYIRRNSTTLQLKSDENFVSINFTAVDFVHSGKILFSYKLEGLEESWSEASERRFASFSHLPGGDYRFLVRVANEKGEWGPVQELIRFNIATPYWKRTWFVLLASLVFTLLIFALYRYRINRVQRSEAHKTRLNKRLAEAEMRALRAQMNPHFIFNCLNSINRYIVKSDQQKASLYLTRFSKLIRLILDNSNSKAVSLEQDLEALKIYIEMESLRFEDKFDFTVEVAPGTDAFNIQVPPMILQPFVENAIWHGLLHKEGKGVLKIYIQKNARHLECLIEDNGVGRKKAMELRSKSATTRKSLGMQLTEERMQLLMTELGTKGEIRVEDLIDSNGEPLGTRVILKLPIEE
jgi:ligand-binding sensor domain-containing protein